MEKTSTVSAAEKNAQPPTDDLFRSAGTLFELREDEDDGMPTLYGHFAVFNRWTEINSWIEGRFMERIAPGAFRKTMRENRQRIRALFQHGRDATVGDKPLGPIETLREDETGGYYEVPLLDTAYNRELLPGLQAGLYGASFRMTVIREEIDEEPAESETNPRALPERTIKEIRLHEFGPVTFPAYEGATAGVRSLTDAFRPAPSGLHVPAERVESTAPPEGGREQEDDTPATADQTVTVARRDGTGAARRPARAMSDDVWLRKLNQLAHPVRK